MEETKATITTNHNDQPTQQRYLTSKERKEMFPYLPDEIASYKIFPAKKKVENRGINNLSKTRILKNEKNFKERSLKEMNKKISKHLNTQKFNEFFAEHIGVELIGQTLKEVLLSEDEKTENKLKAISEINKYNFIPSQAQEIKAEIDTSFDSDKRSRLKELLSKAGNK